MKFISIIALSFITINLYAQERFFTLTDRWMTSSALEYDAYYTVIGTGFTPNYNNKILITKISKTGDYIDSWDIYVNNAIVSEVKSQQSLSCYHQEKVMGITVINESESLIKARRLYLNNDLTVVTDSSWQYTPPLGEEAIMYITHREQANKIVHGLNYHNGIKVRSSLLCTDTLGNTLWERTFSCDNNCWMEPRHIFRAHDGGYIFTNTEQRRLNGDVSVDDHDVATIIKTDSVGVPKWRIHPGGLGEPYTSDHIVLQPTDDGNYLCAWADNLWRTSNFPHYNINPDATIWFAKIDPEGNKIWEKNIQEEIDRWDVDGGYYAMEQMIRLPDSNFVIIAGDKIFKINQDAEIIWARRNNPLGLEFSYEQIFYYAMKGVNHTSDGGFVITGEFVAEAGTVYPEYTQKGFVLKLDEYGCYEENCQENDPVSVSTPQLSIKAMNIYPNPAQESLILSYNIGQQADNISLMVTDVAGRVVHDQTLTSIIDEVQIDTQHWAEGVYLCRLMVDGAVGGVRRVMIVR